MVGIRTPDQRIVLFYLFELRHDIRLAHSEPYSTAVCPEFTPLV